MTIYSKIKKLTVKTTFYIIFCAAKFSTKDLCNNVQIIVELHLQLINW